MFQRFSIILIFFNYFIKPQLFATQTINFANLSNFNRINLQNTSNTQVLRRKKRFLIFQKGAAVTVQANVAKAVLPTFPQGLNEIAEYTLSYDLPTDFHFPRKSQPTKTATTTTTTTRPKPTPELIVLPYNPVYYADYNNPHYWQLPHQQYYSHYNIAAPPHTSNSYNNEHFHSNDIQHRTSFKRKSLISKCSKRNFYIGKKTSSELCLKRSKRFAELNDLNVSERFLYDLIEKWSLMNDYKSSSCFMRTLCEAPHLLLPYGYSLLHDIIHILLSHTKPWAFHHKIFGRSLRLHRHKEQLGQHQHQHSDQKQQPHRHEQHSKKQQYKQHVHQPLLRDINECAKLYGPYCRVSWLLHITTAVHGSKADYMR